MGRWLHFIQRAPAHAYYSADEAMKAAACLPETMTDPISALSEEPTQCAVQRALGTDKALWDYYGTPEGKVQGQRFGVVMAGANKLQPPEAVITGNYRFCLTQRAG